ncbi:MAG: TetR/AcrR family transcriptional regulator [Neisseria sp.]|nr:TetR/AcrR family transcriptional regulator [Neisseria sp.]
MTRDNDHHTIDKILGVAEAQFATQGFFASSLRQITRDAGVNVAAIHYHFGSKEALFLAVLARRIVPFVNQFIDEMNRVAQTKNLQAEDVVNGYVIVIRRLVAEDEQGAVVVSRLVSRLMLDEYKIFRDDLARQYEDIAKKVMDLVWRALPHLDRETVRWRIHIGLSTLFNAFAGNDVLRALMPVNTTIHARDPEQVARYVAPFVVAGLKA